MADDFPEGLRVLVVDNDPASQNRIHTKLSKFKFRVTMCRETQDALFLIQQEEEFDAVITAKNMEDEMDGFKFVQQVRQLKTDLPVIMMVEPGEDAATISKGVKSGVGGFVLKPIQGKKLCLRIIFQRELTKMRKTLPDYLMDAGSFIAEHEPSRKRENKTLPNNAEEVNIRKRKTQIGKDCESSCGSSAAPVKKPRITWSKDIHDKFVKAVNRIGLDKARPKKILKLMKVEGLTTRNVSSHLQKYRRGQLG